MHNDINSLPKHFGVALRKNIQAPAGVCANPLLCDMRLNSSEDEEQCCIQKNCDNIGEAPQPAF